MIVIRRELPLTSSASLVSSDLSHRCSEDSPFRASIDLRSSCPAMAEFLCFYAADWPSIAIPMAQMKPSSSLATAVTTCCLLFSLAVSRV